MSEESRRSALERVNEEQPGRLQGRTRPPRTELPSQHAQLQDVRRVREEEIESTDRTRWLLVPLQPSSEILMASGSWGHYAPP